MAMTLWEKIEQMREEPEHVRQRYVVIAVSVSMVFIIGIWLLSVGENVTQTASDIPKAVEGGKSLVPGTPSLNSLFGETAPLRLETDPVPGKQFLDEEITNRQGEGQ
jgi:hypothetical protein